MTGIRDAAANHNGAPKPFRVGLVSIVHRPESVPNRLTGLLYCADCGAKLTHHNSLVQGKYIDDAFTCSRYRAPMEDCTIHYDTNRHYIMNRQAGIEVYVAGATNKYVTITGQPCTAYEFGDRSDELQQVLERFMIRSQPTAGNAINAVNPPLTTDQLLEKAFSSRRGEAIRRLWSGDTTGYPSHSEADQALCSHLAFWTGRDAGMMDAMFRQSGLMRDKWDRKQASSTYCICCIDHRKPMKCDDRLVVRVKRQPSRPA